MAKLGMGLKLVTKRIPLLGALITTISRLFEGKGILDAISGGLSSAGGAAIGAAIGTIIFPGIGTAIGAVIGGMVGEMQPFVDLVKGTFIGIGEVFGAVIGPLGEAFGQLGGIVGDLIGGIVDLIPGMDGVSGFYTSGPNRVQFQDKDRRGWQEFNAQFKEGSARGHANTMRGVQSKRPSVYELENELKSMTVPLMIMTGDEDRPCLEPGLFLKNTGPSAALTVFPKTGHNINQEEPDLFNRSLLDYITQVDAERWSLRNPASLSESAVLNPAEIGKADNR